MKGQTNQELSLLTVCATHSYTKSCLCQSSSLAACDKEIKQLFLNGRKIK